MSDYVFAEHFSTWPAGEVRTCLKCWSAVSVDVADEHVAWHVGREEEPR